jgi:CRISPR/Cas system CMR-associated protein Cmr5 small subunit
MKKETTQQTNNFIESVVRNWPVILFIGGMLVTWVRFESNISDSKSRISVLESKTEALNNNFSKISVDIAEIKVNLEFIKKKLE